MRLQERAEPGRDRDRCQDHQQIVDRHAEVAGADGAVDEIGTVERARIGAPDELEDVLKHQHQRKRQQQLEALVAGIDGAQQPLDRRADEAEQYSRHDQPRQDQPRRHAVLRSHSR